MNAPKIENSAAAGAAPFDPAAFPWKVAAGDPTCVFVGNAKPIYCGSKRRARLIAAAPELLAVVKRGRQKLATFTSIYTGDKELRELLTAWDAAIAKATGAQP